MDRKQVKGIADVEAAKAVKGHEKKMHGMKKVGLPALTARNTGRTFPAQ